TPPMNMNSVLPSWRISGANPPLTDAELVFGLVAPVGTNFDAVESILKRKLERYGYVSDVIRLSELMKHFKPSERKFTGSQEYARLSQRMHEGSQLRLRSGKGEFLALAAASEIQNRRRGAGFTPRTARIVRSL